MGVVVRIKRNIADSVADGIRDALFIAGFGLVVYGIHLLSIPFAWIGSGVGLMYFCYASAAPAVEQEEEQQPPAGTRHVIRPKT